MAGAWHALPTPSCPSDLAGALTTLFATDRSHTQFEPGSDCLQLMGPASSFGSVLKMLFEVSLAQA